MAYNNSEEIRLTKREKEVLDLITLGYSNTEIAEKLLISRHAANAHVHRLYKKIGVQNRLQITIFGANRKLSRPYNPDEGKTKMPEFLLKL